MKIWLDDVRPAPEGWTHVLTPEVAIRWLKTGDVERISLDHDLGLDDGRTEYTVLLWMEAEVHNGFIPPEIWIDGVNPVAKKRMLAACESIINLRESLRLPMDPNGVSGSEWVKKIFGRA